MIHRPAKITVFGAGVWGSVIARHLASQGCNVTLWEFHDHLLREIEATGRHHPHIPNFRIPETITLTGDLHSATENMEMAVLVISSKGMRPFAKQLGKELAGRQITLISATKGIEASSIKTMCEVVEEEIPHLAGKTMVFSGPSFALEVAHGVPTKIVLAGKDAAKTAEAAKVFDAPPLSMELSDDRTGVEWGGAVKNVLAIGCGILDGLGAGHNTKAALITQGINEIARLIIAAGGRQDTAYGLAGVGDFILTGTSDISRNRRLGEKLGKGKAVTQARGEINTVAEGADSAEAVWTLIQRKNLSAPMITAVWKVLREGAAPETMLKALGFKNGGKQS